jgi:acetyl-CoA C-acetyltransferase
MTGVCLIGWSQSSRHPGEPLEAWADALSDALRPSGVGPGAIDSLDVVYCLSWPYDDPCGRLAAAVGAEPKRTYYSGNSGTTPVRLLGEAAERILAGESRVCAIVGGEALDQVRQLKKAGERPAWSHRATEKQPFPFEAPFHPAEVAHNVFQAYTTFALRDIARRAHLGMSPADHRRSVAELFAPMTTVAAGNPNAWFPVERTPEEVGTPTPTNRMVAYPYTKLLMSILDVDQAGALVVTSTDTADELGVPEDQRIHVRGWGHAQDPDYVAEHLDLWRAPAMGHVFTKALGQAGLELGAIDRADIYSCFPSSVSFALDTLTTMGPTEHLAPYTVTGGLPYAGGAGSNYALLSTAAMATALASDGGATNGLITAVGMHLSKHGAVVLSREPGEPLATRDAWFDPVRRPVVDTYSGDATIAGFTVHHGPDGAATDGLLVCDMDPSGGRGRGYAIVRDADLLAALESDDEWVGRTVTVTTADGVNTAVAP